MASASGTRSTASRYSKASSRASSVRNRPRRHGLELTSLGIDLNRTAARLARSGGLAMIVADGSRLPLGPRSVDVIVASQVLHHLPRAVAVRWIVTFDRVARRAVVLADLRRSRVAMAGVWAASLCLAV